MSNYTITLLSEAISPITHASGGAGNESIAAREPIVTPSGVRSVPFLSGNALRHRCLREPGMLHLIDLYGLRGKLSLLQLNFLLHGGNLTESTAHENTNRIAEMKRCWPLLRLLGGCLPNQVLAGACDALRGMLVCEENRGHLPPELVPPERLMPAEAFIGSYQYTRGDAAEDESREQLMIYSGQAVLRGALFVHGFVLKHVSRVEYGAALHAVTLWQRSGGTIGGMAAKGHGRLKTALVGASEQEDSIGEYLEYAERVRADAVSWLEDAFAKRESKKSKRGKPQVGSDG